MPGSNDPMAAVRQYVDAFNNGDVKAMAAAVRLPHAISGSGDDTRFWKLQVLYSLTADDIFSLEMSCLATALRNFWSHGVPLGTALGN